MLNAATGGTKPAGAPAQTIKLAGTISAAGRHRGTTGDTVPVSGEHIKLANVKIDASGRRGGGKVLIVGDWGGGHRTRRSSATRAPSSRTTPSRPRPPSASMPRSTINASATGRGSGGKVVLWSDSQTTFAGTILAKGGAKSGDGGFVETSSHGQPVRRARGCQRAAGARLARCCSIRRTSTFVRPATALAAPGRWKQAPFQVCFQSQNVVIATDNNPALNGNGDLFVQASINWSSNNSLTLNAYRDINIYDYSPVTITNTGGGSLVLRADSTGTGVGKVNFQDPFNYTQPGDVSLASGTASIFFILSVKPPNSAVISTSYAGPTYIIPHFVTGNSPLTCGEQRLRFAKHSEQSGRHLPLGRDINAGAIPNFVPHPVCSSGVFEGQGQTIAI